MKPIAGALALVMLLAVPAAGAQDATPGDRTKYASYKASAELHCDNSAIYGQVGDSPSWWDANPLQNKDNPYQAIDDAGAINKYTSYLGAIKADASCLSESPTGLEQLDLAKCAYRETQNMLFACYSAASMLRIAEEMQTRFAGDGRAKDMLKRRIDALRKLSVGEGTNEGVCNPINIKAGVSVKE